MSPEDQGDMDEVRMKLNLIKGKARAPMEAPPMDGEFEDGIGEHSDENELNDGKAPKVAIEEKLPGEYKVD
jgi:hypothetical protein